jgi:hypothetical protein
MNSGPAPTFVGLLWYRSFGGQLSFRSYSLSRKPGASGLATCFVTFLVAGACHVLRWTVLSESCCAFNLPVPSCRQLKSSGCLVRRSEHGQSPEMKILTRYVILRAPGRFVLQPEVIASGQGTVAGHRTGILCSSNRRTRRSGERAESGRGGYGRFDMQSEHTTRKTGWPGRSYTRRGTSSALSAYRIGCC